MLSRKLASAEQSNLEACVLQEDHLLQPLQVDQVDQEYQECLLNHHVQAHQARPEKREKMSQFITKQKQTPVRCTPVMILTLIPKSILCINYLQKTKIARNFNNAEEGKSIKHSGKKGSIHLSQTAFLLLTKPS